MIKEYIQADEDQIDLIRNSLDSIPDQVIEFREISDIILLSLTKYDNLLFEDLFKKIKSSTDSEISHDDLNKFEGDVSDAISKLKLDLTIEKDKKRKEDILISFTSGFKSISAEEEACIVM